MLAERWFGVFYGIFFDNFLTIRQVIDTHALNLISSQMLNDRSLIPKDTLLSVIRLMVSLDIFSILFHIVNLHQHELFLLFFLFFLQLKSLCRIIFLNFLIPIRLIHFLELNSTFRSLELYVLFIESRAVHLLV